MLCTLSFIRVSSVKEELLPFDRLNLNNLFCPQPNLNLMNFILSVCDHNMIMHMKFCQDFLGNRRVIALWVSEFQ